MNMYIYIPRFFVFFVSFCLFILFVIVCYQLSIVYYVSVSSNIRIFFRIITIYLFNRKIIKIQLKKDEIR